MPRPKFLRGLADDPGEHPHQHVVGAQQQAAEDQADGEDVGPDAGEVHLQQSAAGRPQVSARADHRSRRELRHGHGRQRGQADQRQAASRPGRSKGWPTGRRAKQHGVQRRQRDQQVIGPQPQAR